MPPATQPFTTALSDTGAIAVGTSLWLAAVACFWFVYWQFAKVLVLIVYGAVAGLFGHRPASLDRFAPRPAALVLIPVIVLVSGVLCGLAYAVPRVRALPGSHQFMVLGALALLAPLAAAVWTARRPR